MVNIIVCMLVCFDADRREILLVQSVKSTESGPLSVYDFSNHWYAENGHGTAVWVDLTLAAVVASSAGHTQYTLGGAWGLDYNGRTWEVLHV